MHRSAYAAARAAKAARHQQASVSRALLVVDNRPLQQAAWRELLAARKRLAKATADLHRHENTDDPAFIAWTAASFPAQLTELRELTAAAAAKQRIVFTVEDESFATGRSPAEIWWSIKNPAPDLFPEDAPPPDADPSDADSGTSPAADAASDPRDAFEKLLDDFLTEHGVDPDAPEADEFRQSFGGGLDFGSRQGPASAGEPTREIYRRLVQHLHPDRGGEWTPQRARLWHEVQRAWAARDHDWLSRLEVEWEAAAEILGPASPVGRLHTALREIEAARRDADRKVRVYRKVPSWRFTLLVPHKRAVLAARTEQELLGELERLRAVLAGFEETIAWWEDSYPPRRKSRGRRRSRRAPPALWNAPWD
ncbi:MAG TPA: hypothetical protein VK178_08835 [Opitutaceae bacterium]|nr:hypothetical protein [Opitutaceae bacterium]